MARGRAFRRDQLEKKKNQARRLWRRWFDYDKHEEPTDKWVGHMASTHCKPCSCWMCKEPKASRSPRFPRRPTRQERLSMLALQEQYNEFYEDWQEWQQHLNGRREHVRYLEQRIEELKVELVQMEAARWPCYPW